MNQLITKSPLRETVATLGAAAQLWLDTTGTWRKDAVQALQVSTGFSREMVEQALNAAFEELTEEKIWTYARNEPTVREGARTPDKVLHILAGNVFTSWLPGAVVTLLLGSRCDLKPSHDDPIFPALWKKSLSAIDPELGNQIQILPWERNLLHRYSAVVAYGTDESLRQLRSIASPMAQFFAYGHKFSFAVISADALAKENLPALMDQLEKDVRPFDLQGCLSPQTLYLEGEDPGIFEGLFARVNVMPHLKRFESWQALIGELQPFAAAISSVGLAGQSSNFQGFKEILESWAVSRICPVGLMQQPPLGWRNGGFSLAERLTTA